jgi:hypothetical protein
MATTMNIEAEIKKLKFQLGLIAGEAACATMSAIVVYQDMDEDQYKRVQDVFDKYSSILTHNKSYCMIPKLPASVDEFLEELKAIVPEIDPMCMVNGMAFENRWLDIEKWIRESKRVKP